MKVLNEKGFTINADKCEWYRKEMEFFGLKFSEKGVSLTEDKSNALMNATIPENKKELHSFLGLGTYCSRFIHRYADDSNELWPLVRKNKQFEWNSNHQKSFDKIRLGIKNNLSYFDVNWHTEIHVDASPVGLAAVLVQSNPRDRSEKRIIAFASRCLSELEKKYSQCEKEALAIVWSCERFHLYIYGSEFVIYSDNKALEFIFNHHKQKPPPRIERWQLRLMPYNFRVIHTPGESNIADYLSRHPIEDRNVNLKQYIKDANDHINAITIESPTLLVVPEDEIIEETLKDFELTLVKKALLLKNKELEKFFELNKNISAFKNHLNDITLSENGVLLKNHRIVIPKSLRNRIVDIAHDGHMGISKTKSLIREHIWFPDIDNMVQDKLKNCLACQANTDNTVIEPLIMSELPKRPWQYLSMDFYEIDGLSFFVLMDEYCRFPIVNELNIANASNVIM